VTPTNFETKPEKIKNILSDNQFKLYDLIWKRTIASQMEQSINLETSYYIKGKDMILKATGSIEKFRGFKEVYNFSDKNDDDQKLPQLKINETLSQNKVEIKQNFTKPPNRFSEAGLIKKLEELGIGRPSTYVSIFTKLEERKYVEIKNKSLIPTSSGKILSKFLDGFFNQFVDYEFTAGLEEQLDQITESKLQWKETLRDFLGILNKRLKLVEEKSITEVIDKINEFSPEILKEKKCPKCDDGELTIKFAFTGPFIGCTNYKKDSNGCKYSHAIGADENNKELSGDGKIIGIHPDLNKNIFLKVGRYGRYLETEIEKDKTKRVSVPKNVPNEDIDLAKSVKLLTLPRNVGTHPVSKKQITASIGPYGPYLKHENKFVSLKEDDVTEIGINRAVELIDKKMLEIKEILIGNHPVTKQKIIKKKGIKGRSDYISYNKKNYPIPKDFNDKDLSLDQAIKIIDEKKDKKKSN
jgi:DNA topoisomerase-1